MNDFVKFVEKWLKKAILVQLVFLLAAQVLLRFDYIVPYLNQAVVYEGVVDHLKSAAETVINFFSSSGESGMY
ncbi:MAG TPA: DUF5359 family protein [Bacillales bacterium]|nr:DUF5359 family protein [Bacillales bacterium]